MPELPEVQTVVSTLAPHVVGQRIQHVQLNRTDIVQPAGFDLPGALAGRRIVSVHRRGKRIVFQLDDAQHFYIHLGMTGRLTLEPADAKPLLHTHLILHLAEADGSNPTAVHFRDPRRFGGIWWLGPNAEGDEPIGPEPLTLRTSQFAKRLAATRRPIKNVLLDQAVLAGVGNIYADEALFAAHLHPLRPASALTQPQVAALNRAIKQVLRRAINHRGSTLRDHVDAHGRAGEFQKLHRVYQRAGEPCLRCGTAIRHLVIAGRSAHFCPTCQPRRKIRGGQAASVR